MSSSSREPTRKAPLAVDFLIVGGGLAGLASAFALGCSGHTVRVLESANGLHQPSAGLRAPPSLTKILTAWGFHDLVRNAQKCRTTALYSIEENVLTGYMHWHDNFIKEIGADFLLIRYEDLHTTLYEAAISVGATVSFDCQVTSIAVDNNKLPYVTLQDGTTLSADVVIGADGRKSLIREFVTEQPDEGVSSGKSFFTVVVPSEELEDDPFWSEWIYKQEWPVWMGDNRCALGYPVSSKDKGHEYVFTLVFPDDAAEEGYDEEGWDVLIPTDKVDLSDCHPSMSRIFTKVPEAMRYKFIRRPIPEDWVDSSGRVLLVGESAHAIQPSTMHNPCLSIEDAVVLGGIMSRIRAPHQIPQLLEAFQDLRRPRCLQVDQLEEMNTAIVTLPPGEGRDIRDEGLQASLQAGQKWTEEQLRDQWDNIGVVFAYDAFEEAEDWWRTWGRLSEANETRKMRGMCGSDVSFHVVQVVTKSK